MYNSEKLLWEDNQKYENENNEDSVEYVDEINERE